MNGLVAILLTANLTLLPTYIHLKVPENILETTNEAVDANDDTSLSEELDKELNSVDEVEKIVDDVDAQGTPKLILGEFSKLLNAVGDTIQPIAETPSFDNRNITEFKGPTGGTFCKIIDGKDAIYVQIPNLDKTYKISSESIENYFYSFIEDTFNMKIKR